jgi:hypothetical protein
MEADRTMRTAPDPLSSFGHAVGVVRIVIDFRAGTKTNRPAAFISHLIYQSLDWLATGPNGSGAPDQGAATGSILVSCRPQMLAYSRKPEFAYARTIMGMRGWT